MTGWTAESNGSFRLQFGSLDEFMNWINQTVAPSAQQYGYRVLLEPVPKDETAVDRA